MSAASVARARSGVAATPPRPIFASRTVPSASSTAYPIATYTYIILPTKSSKATELRKLVYWALTQGQQGKYTAKLWFAPIPKTVLVASEKTLKQITPAT